MEAVLPGVPAASPQYCSVSYLSFYETLSAICIFHPHTALQLLTMAPWHLGSVYSNKKSDFQTAEPHTSKAYLSNEDIGIKGQIQAVSKKL